MSTSILWFRNDLRLHDNEALHNAAAASSLLPIYFLDPRQFAKTKHGFVKTGAHRARFLLESLGALRKNLRTMGSDLLVVRGKPEEYLPVIVERLKVSSIHFHHEVTEEEVSVERKLALALVSFPTRLYGYHGASLYHPDDLPFKNSHDFPDIFTQFRKEIEKRSSVRHPFPKPKSLPSFPREIEVPAIPGQDTLGITPIQTDQRAVLPFNGGETEALARLDHYFWKSDHLATYKETRNGLLGADYSSKFSPWLANGSISPRYIYSEVRRYEHQRVNNSSTYWLIFELIWRDFFRFMAMKYGSAIFKPGGMRNRKVTGKSDESLFHSWIDGRTGYPFVDANMRELAQTGFMSNRGRQNMASFLVRDLGLHWRLGAEYFESLLIDYDPCSNYGNWNYVAGVGNDPREDRYFNVLKQADDYDCRGDYVRHWIPELASIHDHRVHRPWSLGENERRQIASYPAPVVTLRGR